MHFLSPRPGLRTATSGLYPVPQLCDSALAKRNPDGASRLSLRHSFLLKVKSSVSAYVGESALAFYLYDVMRARSFYSHYILARRRGLDVACTVRNEAMSEQYWLRERDIRADLVRQMELPLSRAGASTRTATSGAFPLSRAGASTRTATSGALPLSRAGASTRTATRGASSLPGRRFDEDSDEQATPPKGNRMETDELTHSSLRSLCKHASATITGAV